MSESQLRKEPKNRVTIALMIGVAALPIACFIALLANCTEAIVHAQYGPEIELEGRDGKYTSIQVKGDATKEVSVLLSNGKTVLLNDVTSEMILQLFDPAPLDSPLIRFDEEGKLKEATLFEPAYFSIRGSKYVHLPATRSEAERVLGKPTSKRWHIVQKGWAFR
jgi:hypothetical protein